MSESENTTRALYILEQVEGYEESLSHRDISFLEDMLEKRDKYGERLHCSDRQLEWLESIMERLGF